MYCFVDAPWFMLCSTTPPEGLDVGVPGEPMPWEEWDMTALVVRHLLHFSQARKWRGWSSNHRPGTTKQEACVGGLAEDENGRIYESIRPLLLQEDLISSPILLSLRISASGKGAASGKTM
jgi:hypothetical protein